MLTEHEVARLLDFAAEDGIDDLAAVVAQGERDALIAERGAE